MRTLIAILLTSTILLSSTAEAQPSASPPVQIAGRWQGTLMAGAARLRIVLQIRQNDAGALQATLYSIDQTPSPIPATSVELNGSSFQMKVDAVMGRYAGTVSADGNHIKGHWTQGAPLALDFERATADNAWSLDSSPHKVKFVTVDGSVKLEVLDWGGPGPPVILLAGLGSDAHVFDRFAPKLTAWYHVYGITRRGFGASSSPAPGFPATGYSAQRLGEDVVAVMNALQIDHPVLIGHSIAGEELSYVGSHHPEKVAGLVYMDARYSYAFYDSSGRALASSSVGATQVATVAIDTLQRNLTQLIQLLNSGNGRAAGTLIDEIMANDLPQVRTAIPVLKSAVKTAPAPTSAASLPPQDQAILADEDEFTTVRAPILAIFADPHSPLPGPPGKKTAAQIAAAEASDKSFVEAQIATIQRYSPQAHIVRLPHANHAVFLSNEKEVLDDIHGFIQTLPPRE